MATGPFFFSQPFNEPKRKYKFFVEFDGGEKGSSIGHYFPNKEYVWFIKSCSKPSIKVEVTPREETISIFNTPVATRRINEGSTWNPITIKFINPFSHTFKPAIDDLSTNKEDFRGPIDLDYFFSIVMQSINANFGGNFIVTNSNSSTTGGGEYRNQQDAISAYLSSLSAAERTNAESKAVDVVLADAAKKGFVVKEATLVKDQKTGAIDYSQSCRGSAAISAVCKFNKFFGNIKIWDLGNGYFTLEEAKRLTELEKSLTSNDGDIVARLADTNNNGTIDPNEAIAEIDSQRAGKSIFSIGDTFPMGYWFLINPYIESIDVGSHEYTSDELQEYTLTIGYDSAKYFSLLNTSAGDQVSKELKRLRTISQ